MFDHYSKEEVNQAMDNLLIDMKTKCPFTRHIALIYTAMENLSRLDMKPAPQKPTDQHKDCPNLPISPFNHPE